MSDIVSLPLSVGGAATLRRGLWTLDQQAADLAQGFPPRLFLTWPPAAPFVRRTNSGPPMTQLDPTSVAGSVEVAARVFSVWGQIQLTGLSNPSPNNVSVASFVRLGEPHPFGSVPLVYQVQNAAPAPLVWVPQWDGDYRVWDDLLATTLLATRLSGEPFRVPAATTVVIQQQARL